MIALLSIFHLLGVVQANVIPELAHQEFVGSDVSDFVNLPSGFLENSRSGPSGGKQETSLPPEVMYMMMGVQQQISSINAELTRLSAEVESLQSVVYGGKSFVSLLLGSEVSETLV